MFKRGDVGLLVDEKTDLAGDPGREYCPCEGVGDAGGSSSRGSSAGVALFFLTQEGCRLNFLAEETAGCCSSPRSSFTTGEGDLALQDCFAVMRLVEVDEDAVLPVVGFHCRTAFEADEGTDSTTCADICWGTALLFVWTSAAAEGL